MSDARKPGELNDPLPMVSADTASQLYETTDEHGQPGDELKVTHCKHGLSVSATAEPEPILATRQTYVGQGSLDTRPPRRLLRSVTRRCLLSNSPENYVFIDRVRSMSVFWIILGMDHTASCWVVFEKIVE